MSGIMISNIRVTWQNSYYTWKVNNIGPQSSSPVGGLIKSKMTDISPFCTTLKETSLHSLVSISDEDHHRPLVGVRLQFRTLFKSMGNIWMISITLLPVEAPTLFPNKDTRLLVPLSANHVLQSPNPWSSKRLTDTKLEIVILEL